MKSIENAASAAKLAPLECMIPLQPVTCACDAVEATVLAARAAGFGQAVRRAINATAVTIKYPHFEVGFTRSVSPRASFGEQRVLDNLSAGELLSISATLS